MIRRRKWTLWAGPLDGAVMHLPSTVTWAEFPYTAHTSLAPTRTITDNTPPIPHVGCVAYRYNAGTDRFEYAPGRWQI